MKQLFITSVRDFEKNTMGTVEMREMPMPEPAEDEVRIKIIYSSICGSDAHTLTGHLGEFEEGTKAMLPMTFGHELSGVIDKVGPKAEALGYHVGDKVIANYAKYCYACDNCRSGHENLCSHVQFCMNGFAEYAVYHVTQVHKLPENYDLETAALIEPLTIALAAAEQAHISYGKSVAIMGAGGIGLMLVQLARLAGASCVTVFDLVEEKCELAKQLGADYAFDPRKEGALEEAMKVACMTACSRAPALSPPRRTRSSSSPATATASILQCTAKTLICRSICTRTSTGIRSTCTASSWARACSPRPSSSLRV